MSFIKRNAILIIIGLFISFLPACSNQTYSKRQCLEFDGRNDAMSGRAQRTELYIAHCNDGVSLDDIKIKEYSNAYEKALPIFCSETTAFDYGLSGQEYENICGAQFDEEYVLGFSLFDVKHQIWKYQNNVDRLKRLKGMALGNGQGAQNTDDYQRKIREIERSIALTRAKQIQLRKRAVEEGFLEKTKTLFSN